nr:MAG TPA: hypothetical protein [Caudoviricetes sp.]
MTELTYLRKYICVILYLRNIYKLWYNADSGKEALF